MQATNLKTNHRRNPVGIDGDRIFLSWTCAGGMRQSAYQIFLFEGENTVWDSGKVESPDMHLTLPFAVSSRKCLTWSVMLWDETEEAQAAKEVAFFETGLKKEEFVGKWVNPELERLTVETYDCSDAINAFEKRAYEEKSGDEKPANMAAPASAAGGDLAAMAAKMTPEQRAAAMAMFQKKTEAATAYEVHQPASYLRKKFYAAAGERKRLYITARGLYEAYLNGKRVGNAVLMPGSFTADKQLAVQTYDIGDLLNEGENELVVSLGDGWYRSASGVSGDRNVFGTELGLLYQIEVDGKVADASDHTMEATQEGPVRQNDMQQGEVYDARKENFYNEAQWHGVKTEDIGDIVLLGSNNVAIKEQEYFAGTLLTTPDGSTVLDFSQNLAGYIEIEAEAHEGQYILLTCGETLDENGNFSTEHFQDRKRHKEGGVQQCIQLICKEGRNRFKPHFTIMGFQYARVETDFTKEQLENAKFTSHAVYSDMPMLGSFRCGNEDVNRLVENSVWSQKSNFVDVPTDCPTRERAGWTGDMGVFAHTGLYLTDCYPVMEKWLGECRINQYEDGRLSHIAPPAGKPSGMTEMLCASVGWGDASVIVPYEMYQRTGDPGILADNYEMMTRWMDFLASRAAQTTEEQVAEESLRPYTVLAGMDYGEWCEPGVTPQQAMMNPRKNVGTAYYSRSAGQMAEIARILGKEEDAANYEKIQRKAAEAYCYSFTENGTVFSERQCDYVRPIAFDLLNEEEKKAAADTLNTMVVKNGYHLNTGFLSTPYLCDVLSRYGHTNTAYQLLLQEEAPGWLYAVKKGANTIWETWNGIDENGVPHESLNHYSYGAICGWLFDGVCGIKQEGRHITIAPTPHKALEYAKAVCDSPVGRIESAWKYEGDKIRYRIVIPSNTEAELILPDGTCKSLQPGLHEWSV